MAEQKPGYKTTEFWITIIGVISGLIMSALPESQTTSIVGSVLAAICGGAYSMGRSLIKSKGETGRAMAGALLESQNKKKEKGLE
tara:strand:+ start:1239 stop:1493 length:255 start_codon:yes stop_codon:yes gene_type:complete